MNRQLLTAQADATFVVELKLKMLKNPVEQAFTGSAAVSAVDRFPVAIA